jgi:3-hydroxybutyryl-CoA dehydrogenase
MDKRTIEPVAIVGLGLMGRSIAACLLAAGHPVVGVTPPVGSRRDSRERIGELLGQMRSEGLLEGEPAQLLERLEIGEDYAALSGCTLVVESVIEDWDVKRETLRRVEECVRPEALIASNTSAIPITLLQRGATHPERVLGIHWAEPAHITRFMEIVCGKQTSAIAAQTAVELARGWGKEPTLIKRDIRGFIANRIMYAMMREAFFLVDNGYATPADVDRSVRNDLGWWITFAGPFRYMDLTGIPAYASVMKDLFPELDCSKEVPALMCKTVAAGGRGVSNANGFYPYTPESARRWEELFLEFSYKIRSLAQEYPENAGG